MKQKLGEKKLKRCQQIGGKDYYVCYVRGGRPHFQAECWYVHRGANWADWVNYRTGECEAYVRDGK